MPTTTTTPETTAEAAVTTLEPETARALLGLARDATTLRARLVDLLDAFDGLGHDLSPPGATDLHPDGAADASWLIGANEGQPWLPMQTWGRQPLG